MKLIYHPDEFLEKKLKDVDIKNPSFDPIELKEKMIDFMLSNNGISEQYYNNKRVIKSDVENSYALFKGYSMKIKLKKIFSMI